MPTTAMPTTAMGRVHAGVLVLLGAASVVMIALPWIESQRPMELPPIIDADSAGYHELLAVTRNDVRNTVEALVLSSPPGTVAASGEVVVSATDASALDARTIAASGAITVGVVAVNLTFVLSYNLLRARVKD